MILQYMRLIKMRDYMNRRELEFRVELPDADTEDSDSWLDCGRVLAQAEAGLLEYLKLEMNPTFIEQLEGDSYEAIELIQAIVLWTGWESNLITTDMIRVDIDDSVRQIQCEYFPESNEIREVIPS